MTIRFLMFFVMTIGLTSTQAFSATKCYELDNGSAPGALPKLKLCVNESASSCTLSLNEITSKCMPTQYECKKEPKNEVYKIIRKTHPACGDPVPGIAPESEVYFGNSHDIYPPYAKILSVQITTQKLGTYIFKATELHP